MNSPATTDRGSAATPTTGPVGFCIQLAASVVIVLSAWASLLILIWNLNRGFDLTDESFLLYTYRHPDSFLDRLFYQYFRLVRALVPPELDQIVFYRLFKLVGLLAFTGLFSAVFVRWLARRFDGLAGHSLHPIVLFHFLLMGSFLAYCHGSQTLSYNDLVTFVLLGAAAACFALDLGPDRIHPALWKFSISLLIGCFLVLLIPIKWSSAALLSGYYLIFVCFIGADRRKSALLASFAGTIAGAAALAFAISDVGIGTTILFAQLIDVFRVPEYIGSHDDIPGILKSYVTGIDLRVSELFRFPTIVASLLLPTVTIVASAFAQGRPAWRLPLVVLVAATLLSLAAFAGQAPNWAWNHLLWFNRAHVAELQTFAFVSAWLGACCCLLIPKTVILRRDLVMFTSAAALLAMLPAVGSIGSDNPLLTQFIRHMAPLFAALAVTAAFLGLAGRWRPFGSVVCGVIAGLSAVQLAFVVLLYPYRLAQPGISQVNALAEPPHMAGLKVDLPTKTFIERLLAEARRAVGDTTGMPVLAMFDIPGVVYILDGIAVGSPWHSSKPNLQQAICHRIQTDPRSRTELRLIALDTDALSVAMVECLGRAGIDFSALVEIARIPNPYPGQRTVRLLTNRKENP